MTTQSQGISCSGIAKGREARGHVPRVPLYGALKLTWYKKKIDQPFVTSQKERQREVQLVNEMCIDIWKWAEDFDFFFHFWKWAKFVLGLPFWKFSCKKFMKRGANFTFCPGCQKPTLRHWLVAIWDITHLELYRKPYPFSVFLWS